jgi:selenocysteine lyase/cysteine desulfurase
LRWVNEAQAQGYHVLLDAAAYAPTSPLSLSEVPADFVALSLPALRVSERRRRARGAARGARHARAELLRRGTVQFVSVQNDVFRSKGGSVAFEDGTPNFLAMPVVCEGLRWLTDASEWRPSRDT